MLSMTYRYRYAITILVALLMLCVFFPYAAKALTTSSKIEVAGDPGTVVTGDMLIYNDQDAPATFYFSTANFEAQGESGTPNFVESTTGLASWIQAPTSISLAAGEQQVVRIVIPVPADARAGGYFAGVFLSTTAPEAQNNGQVSIGYKVGTLVLLRVNGEIAEGASLLDFKPEKRLYTSLPVNFTYRFQNGGSDRISPTGTITVKNMIGITSQKLDANPGQGNVLPLGTIRKFEVAWDSKKHAREASTTGFFNTVGYQWKHFAFGRYSAKLLVTYSEVQGELTAHTAVYVFPWQLLLVLIIAIVLLFTILRTLIRRYNRWVINQARQSLMQSGDLPPQV